MSKKRERMKKAKVTHDRQKSLERRRKDKKPHPHFVEQQRKQKLYDLYGVVNCPKCNKELRIPEGVRKMANEDPEKRTNALVLKCECGGEAKTQF